MNAEEEEVGVNEEGVIDYDDDMEIVDEEDGDEMEEEEEDEDGEDLDDYEFDVESDDDRDVNALDPLYLQFGRGMHGGGRHRGGRGGQRDERDILFNQNDHDHGGGLYLGGYRNPPRPLGGNPFARFESVNLAQDDEYGRNWSREEEEVSQILRNLRGLQSQSDMNQRGHPPPLPHRMYGAGPPGSSVESHRYHIELEVNNPIQSSDDADPNNPGGRRNSRKSID
jgi:hypothetical protein